MSAPRSLPLPLPPHPRLVLIDQVLCVLPQRPVGFITSAFCTMHHIFPAVLLLLLLYRVTAVSAPSASPAVAAAAGGEPPAPGDGRNSSGRAEVDGELMAAAGRPDEIFRPGRTL